jgi:hypothetical protein
MNSWTRPLVAVLLCAVSGAAPLVAQEGFLFRPPLAQVILRAGPMLPRAQSDIFDFMTTELTLDRSDFLAPALSAEIAVLEKSRFDVGLGFGWAESHSRSEFREFIGDDGLPIEQTTKLRIMPLTLSARLLGVPRGRTLSNLAWLPATLTPYVGGGVGLTFYRLEQQGEFINPSSSAIFIDEYSASGRAFTGHAMAGADYWFSPRVGANLEGRYSWGGAGLTGSFRTYDRIDLSGMQLGIGVSFRW